MGEGTDARKERNIMILFLSEFKLEDATKTDQDKVHGTIVNGKIVDGSTVKALSSNFKRKYIFHDGREDIIECSHTNDAPIRDAVDYLWKTRKDTLDKLFYFCTNKLQAGSGWLWDEGELYWYDTPEELFKTRIRKICSPHLDGTELIAIPFDTTSKTPIQECINAVVDLEDAITANIPREEMESCHLFADITGGIRTANMVMTAVRQLLQYNRIHLDLVLYSDGHVVSDVRDIDNLYKLVAGLEAFTNYGRSDTIEKYFGFDFLKKENDNSKSNLESLLVAMHHFADAMSLCWPDHIIKALEDLIDALDKYPTKSNDPKEKLLIQLLPTIREKYVSLYSRKDKDTIEVDRLAVIGWCIENNLIQPALTFCTEWLPKYIVDYGAVYTDDRAIQIYCKQQKKDGDKETNGKKFFVMDFPMNRPNQEQAEIDEKTGKKTKYKKTALKRIAENALKVEKDKIVEARGNLSEDSQLKTIEGRCKKRISAFVKSIEERLNNLNLPIDSDDEDAQIFNALIKTIKNAKKELPSPITPEEVYEQMKAWTWKDIIDKFHHGSPKTYVYVERFDALDDDSSKKAEEICLEMLYSGLMKTSLRKYDGTSDYEKAAEYIRRYTNIRSNIRNTSLHAADTMKSKKKVPQSFTEVKNELEICLQLMKNLVKDERAIAHKAKNVWPDARKKTEVSK